MISLRDMSSDKQTANKRDLFILHEEQHLPSFKDTFLLRLKNDYDRKDFQLYCENTMMSYVSMFMVFFIYSCAWMTFAIFATLSQADSEPHPPLKCLATMFATWLLLFAALLAINCKKNKSDFQNNMRTFAENTLMILGTVGMGLALIYRVQSGPCEINNIFSHLWHCNPYADVHALPQDFVVMLMIYPIIFPAIYQSIRFETVLGSWLINVVAVVIAINIPAEALNNSYTSLVFYGPASLILICDLQRQNLSTYFMSCQQKYLLVENVRLAEESQTEMRHMIGNVAHDLKTPLASLQSAVDMISGEVKELSNTNNNKNNFSQTALENVSAIESYLTDVKNVNAFMLMTINRCIDYTKTSNGFKLVPKQETVNLANVLRLPMKCMNDMQKNIAVVFKTTTPSNVCTHIITDKQWLQENILCLLSNAVKYSNGGEVTVNVSLVNPSQNEANMNAKRLKLIAEQKASRELSTSISVERLAKSKLCEDGVAGFSGRIAVGTGNIEATAGPLTMDILTSSTDIRQKPPPSLRLQQYIDRSRYGNNSITSVKYKIRPVEQLPAAAAEVNITDFNKDIADVGVQPTVHTRHTVSGANNKAMLIFEIEDTGIGISEAVMAKLFTPFKQAQRHAGGTGLGLFSLARRIEALGGHYGVENRPDGQPGSLFWFTIPYRPDVAAGLASTTVSPNGSYKNSLKSLHKDNTCTVEIFADSSPSESTPTDTMRNGSMDGEFTSPESSQKNKKKASLRMLVVDDSLAILKMTSMMLRKQGHSVMQAKNGAEALEILNKALFASSTVAENSATETDNTHSMFDVVLMDLQMPVMDGLEATRRYRDAEKAANQTRVAEGKSELHQLMISFSANSDDVTMSDALDIGFDAFIGKPFTLETFNAVCNTKMHMVAQYKC